MKNVRVFLSAVVLLLGASGLAHATCWELGLRIKNDANQYVSTPVSIYRYECGGLVWSGSSTSTPAGDGTNLRINLNSTCPGAISLTEDIRYTFVFTGWGNKAFYYQGNLIPGQPVDDEYVVKPSSVVHYSGPGVQEIWGYPYASWTPLCLTLSVISATPIGDKTAYVLRGTAAGGSPYSFSWSNATMTTGVNVNPSQASRTVLNSQTVTVSCTVNGVLTKSIVIGGGAVAPTSAEPTTWSRVKILH